MPITIDGDGTISGVSVGGLPDGIVDADMLASNAVTTAKISDSQITEAKLASDPQQGIAKAWVNFDGTGSYTINDSFNVSNIIDQDPGEYDIVMTNAMSNANYAVAALTSIATNKFRGIFERRDGTTRSTTTFRITNAPHSASQSGVNSGETDCELISVIVFGD